MTKRQRLTLQQILNEIFVYPLSENNEEDPLEERYIDSAEYLPELDEEDLNEVTYTRNKPVRST